MCMSPTKTWSNIQENVNACIQRRRKLDNALPSASCAVLSCINSCACIYKMFIYLNPLAFVLFSKSQAAEFVQLLTLLKPVNFSFYLNFFLNNFLWSFAGTVHSLIQVFVLYPVRPWNIIIRAIKAANGTTG